MVLMTLNGIFFGLYNSSTYGCGMEATTPQHATLMYGVLTLATGLGSFAASYSTGMVIKKHTHDLGSQNYSLVCWDNSKQLLCTTKSVSVHACDSCDRNRS